MTRTYPSRYKWLSSLISKDYFDLYNQYSSNISMASSFSSYNIGAPVPQDPLTTLSTSSYHKLAVPPPHHSPFAWTRSSRRCRACPSNSHRPPMPTLLRCGAMTLWNSNGTCLTVPVAAHSNRCRHHNYNTWRSIILVPRRTR